MKHKKTSLGLLLLILAAVVLFPQFALADDTMTSEPSVETFAISPAQNATVRHRGTVGQGGAPWRLYSDGTLIVEAGFIEWERGASPWHIPNYPVFRIGFTGPITAGSSLDRLFQSLTHVREIQGLHFFDNSNVTSMMLLFSHTHRLTSLDLSGFDTSNVTNMHGMFASMRALTDLNLSGFDTSSVTDMGAMFSFTDSLRNLDLSSFDTSNVTNMASMFQGTNSLTNLNLSSFDTSSVTSMRSMFSTANSLTSLNLSHFDTSNVTSMESMFFGMYSLTNLNLSSFDTSNVTNMRFMFEGTSDLTSLNLSHFDTSSVTTMERMFLGTSSLTNLNLSGFDTSNTTGMSGMFSGASSLTNLNLSHFDTSNVRNMAGMFSRMYALTNLNLSSFDTNNVTTMNSMFNGASRLTSLNLSHFDTSNVTDMSSMFRDTNSLTRLDLSSFDHRNLRQMQRMFDGADALRQITLGEQFAPRRYLAQPFLPVPPQDHYFTGFWQNIGDGGTVARPMGAHVLSAWALVRDFDGATMADTWVWQPRNPPTHPFTDVGGHWAHDSIELAYLTSLMRGTSSTTFSPNTSFSRAMLVAILWRIEGEPFTAFHPVFLDVLMDAPLWYRDAVIWASENGIVQGNNGRFDPNGAITREAFVAMLYRYAQFSGADLSVSANTSFEHFTDWNTISPWAIDYMRWAVYQELISGTNDARLHPTGTATRAEAATILVRFINNR